MTFVEISDGYYIKAEAVVVVKRISKNRCALWVRGQSAMDGFVVERNAEELLQEIVEACSDEDEDDGIDDDDE